MSRLGLFSALVSVLVIAPLASAVAAPGLTLPAGKVNLAVNAEVGMSEGAALEPLALAPDVSYGVDDALTVALVHSRFATTGFRAAAGGGLCVSGTDGGCPNVYDNAGAEAWYRLGSGSVALAGGGGFHAISFDGGFYAAKLGLKARWSSGAFALQTLPSVFVAVTERSAENVAGTRVFPDRLWLPVQAMYRVTADVTLGAGSGIKGPVQGFGDAWQVPLGAMVQYTVDPSLGLGASLVFGQVVGGGDATGFDYRGVQIWLSYTM